MINRDQNEHPDQPHWVDHLQNAIDLAGANLTTAQSRLIAENWDNIFMEAEAQQDNCPDCEAEHLQFLQDEADHKFYGHP